MKLKLEMKEKDLLGKKLRVLINNKTLYYTIKDIKEITEDYLLFVDKFDNDIFLRFRYIDSIMEADR